jgi:diguanylate cyclase (GGDEF)-like protein
LARTDDLTGLNNRRAFYELSDAAIRQAQRYGHPVSFVMLDIDHFKAINDKHGHAVGDEVIRAFGQLLLDSYRSTDVACRFGGEEFAVLLPETDAEAALATSERLRTRVTECTVSHHHAPVHFTTSLGVAELKSGQSLEQLIAEADNALYEAKRAGRNRTVMAARGRAAEAAS